MYFNSDKFPTFLEKSRHSIETLRFCQMNDFIMSYVTNTDTVMNMYAVIKGFCECFTRANRRIGNGSYQIKMRRQLSITLVSGNGDCASSLVIVTFYHISCSYLQTVHLHHGLFTFTFCYNLIMSRHFFIYYTHFYILLSIKEKTKLYS